MTRQPHRRRIWLDERPAYAHVLEAAWAEHQADKPDDAPTVVSTFAGCGGSSLGYSMAGFREVLAVEWNPNAAQSFKANYPHVPLFEGDITDLSDAEALRLAGLKPGELDVFDGSPPCQGFSTAGRRIMDDPRNSLFREYVRLMRAFNPKAFVFENVSGMVKGKMRLTFVEILRELKAQGYRVSCRVLDAQWFDVPQARQRVIFVGIRNDLGIEPRHPQIRPGARIWSLRNVLPALMSTRSQRINPWMNGEGPAATLCATAAGYEAEAAAILHASTGGYQVESVDRPLGTLTKQGGVQLMTGGVMPVEGRLPNGASTGIPITPPARAVHDTGNWIIDKDISDGPSPALTVGGSVSNAYHFGIEGEAATETIDDGYPSKRANPHSVDRAGRSMRTTGRFYLNQIDEPRIDADPPIITGKTEPGEARLSARVGKRPANVSGQGLVKVKGAGSFARQEIDPNGPSPSLNADGMQQRFAVDESRTTTRRALTIEEAKIIGSFPEPFMLIGTYGDRWARIGNSVPPLLMRAIARDLRALLAHAEPPPDDLYARARVIEQQPASVPVPRRTRRTRRAAHGTESAKA